MTVFEKIEAQQKGKEGTIVYEVGEQLKDICRAEPECAGIVAEDLENPDMSIDKAERHIEAWARKQKRVNGGVGVSGAAADKLLREFYGLPAASTHPQHQANKDFLDLDDFLM